MAMAKVAPRKQQQIDRSHRLMFIWIAAVSVVVGICAVLAFSLWQQLAFQTKVVNKKNQTVEVLRNNNAVVDELRQNVQKLETDTNLNRLRVNDEKALQVILDALPATGNSLALGASLQKSLVEGIDGLNVQTLTVGRTADESSKELDNSQSTTLEDAKDNTIPFELVVETSNSDSLKKLLTNFEKSIRIIDISNLKIERSDDKYTMTISAYAYYEPAKKLELRNEKITPESK